MICVAVWKPREINMFVVEVTCEGHDLKSWVDERVSSKFICGFSIVMGVSKQWLV